MKPPDSVKVIETQNSSYWFENDIMYVVLKKAPELPLEETKKQTEEFKKMLNGKKICAIMDFTNSSPSSKESREYSRKQIADMFNAIAFISNSVFGRTIAHLFFGFVTLPFPVKVFANKEDAKQWVHQYHCP